MNKNKQEIYTFQAETNQLLHLMIHSLYSNKEIFIRELISNASDAIDKMRFQFLSKNKDDIHYREMHIRIIIDKKNNKIVISDNGIGMNKEEIIKNLGMIANSGTKKFLQSLSPKKIKNNQLIGQFGVGFYSAFIVSDKVIVKTRHNKENNPDNSIIWESDGKGTYCIDTGYKQEFGTEIELHLKQTEKEFLEHWKISEIINKYSDHISVPIEIQEYDEKNKIISWKQINKAQALWTLQKNEIQEKEYIAFYQYLTKDTKEPLTWSHRHVEGNQEHILLLYIPQKSTWNIWDREHKNKGLKLYVKRIYIMDDAHQFIPNYLRFIKGILDTNYLPLNVSREIIQNDNTITILKKSITKKILQLIKKISIQEPEKYKIFWKEFGFILKEGIAEDIQNQQDIAKLLRFTSIKNSSQENTLSLEEYVQNMHNKQEKIYYLTADNYDAAKTSPHIEIFQKNDIDVLLLFDRVDDWMMSYLTAFQGKTFHPVNKIDKEFEKEFNNKINDINITPELTDFLNKIKKILNKQVTNVVFSSKLINSPSALTTETSTMSTQMSKLFTAAGHKVPPIKYIFEVNPNHDLIKKIIKFNDDKKINMWVQILFEQALLSEQGTLKNPNTFINNINTILVNQ